MQKISKEILIKSLSYNTFYPRDILKFKIGKITFSFDLNDECDAFISLDFDEIGYARRYSKKYLFYKSEKISEEELIKASIYGADGLVFDKICTKKLLSLSKNCGLHLAFIAKSNFDLLKAVARDFDIIIACEKMQKNIPNSKIKGELK